MNSGKDVYCEKPLTHNIHEFIEVHFPINNNELVITDWEEEITGTNPPDFPVRWGAGSGNRVLTLGPVGGGQTVGPFLGDISPDGKTISWDFPPQPQPFVMIVVKELEYFGDQTYTAGNIQVNVDEYFTTPEPTTMTLLALGGLTALRRHRS